MTAVADTEHPTSSKPRGGFRVLTVGGAMIDTIAIIDSASIEHMMLRNAEASFLLLEEGRKTEAIEISTHCGGGAVNAAVSFARLGHRPSALIKVGDDRRADQILATLDKEGISPRWVLRDARAPTGASVLVSSHDRNAAVFTFRGANTLLVVGDLADEAFDADLVYIANLSNEAAMCFPDIVRKAKAAGARVAANPGIRQLHGHGGAFRALLSQLDILALNRREADEVVSLLPVECDRAPGETLTTCDGHAPALITRGLKFESRRMSVRAFCRALIDLGVGTVVLTDGDDGAFAATGNRLVHCAPYEASVAGTAGAGDAFVSTFSAFLATGRSLESCLRAASLNASAVLGHIDTQTGLLRDADIEAMLGSKRALPIVMEWPL